MYSAGNVERFDDGDQTAAIHHISCNRAAQSRMQPASQRDDYYCFILGSTSTTVTSEREEAAGCWSVKRYLTAFIHTQMRFIGPPRASRLLHHSTTKSTSSAAGRTTMSTRPSGCCFLHVRFRHHNVLHTDSICSRQRLRIVRRWIDRDQNDNLTDPTQRRQIDL